MTKDSTVDWRDELWARRSDLFDPAAPFVTRIGTLREGWRETVQTMCDRLAEAAADENGGHIRIARMENDRGAMLVDWQATAPRSEFAKEIAEIVARASARSACTCETCGRAGRRYRSGDWTIAACPIHMTRGAVEVMPNWPTIRIARGFVGGRSQITTCEVYDRERDRFVVARPIDLGIEDFP
jgi:hypothetical protein